MIFITCVSHFMASFPRDLGLDRVTWLFNNPKDIVPKLPIGWYGGKGWGNEASHRMVWRERMGERSFPSDGTGGIWEEGKDSRLGECEHQRDELRYRHQARRVIN